MSAVDRSRGRTHNKSARVCPLQFWRISAICCRFSRPFSFSLYFQFVRNAAPSAGRTHYKFAGVFPLLFWSVSAHFCKFLHILEILSFAKRTSAELLQGTGDVRRQPPSPVPLRGFLGGVGFRDKHDLSGGAQWRARRAFEHFSARLEYGKEINQNVGRNQ